MTVADLEDLMTTVIRALAIVIFSMTTACQRVALSAYLDERIEAYAEEAQLPDAAKTPGATNPAITAETQADTICNPAWSTKSIRPPAVYTSKLKRQQMKAWGLPGTPAAYEEDHLISLELGGHPTDPLNLWPEAYGGLCGARIKDRLENTLHRLVCAHTLTLEQAQTAIRTDWIAAYRLYVGELMCEP